MLIKGLIFAISIFMSLFPCLSFSMGEKPKKIEQSSNLEVSIFQIQREIRQTIDDMIEAYKSRNINSFMNYVAEDYTGERTDLEWSVRKDFSNFYNIDIRYSINNITIDSKGEFIQVALNFTRSYVEIKTGKPGKDSGQSILIFKLLNKRAKLYSMREQKLFGISK